MADRARISICGWIRALVLALALAWPCPAAYAAEAGDATPGAAYDAVFTEMTRWDHRLPGSEGWSRSFERIESVLRGAGLEVHRQTFPALAPSTRVCRLSIDGREIAGVLPLAANGIALPTTWGAPIEAPLVYVGDGTLEAMRGKPVAGAIAVLEFGSPTLQVVFNQGARAVLLVDNDRADHWRVRAHFTSLPLSMPLAWIPRPAAEAAGLLSAGGAARASLEISCRWQEVRGINLWTKIPASAPAEALEDAKPLALTLFADVDTSGAVPGFCPQERDAANAALLAEVAARLARARPARAVYVVFCGARYGNNPGARSWYWPVGSVVRKGETELLAKREQDMCLGGLGRIERQLKMLPGLDFVPAQGDEEVELYVQAKQRLVGQVNDVNYRLRELHLEKSAIERAIPRLEAATGADDTARTAAATARDRLQALLAEMAEIEKRKSALNTLRAQLGANRIDDKAGFATVAEWMRARLHSRQRFYQEALEDTRAARAIEQALRAPEGDVNETIAAHFTFDFAEETGPWTPASFGNSFGRQLNAYADAWQRLPQPDTRTPLWIPDASMAFDVEDLSFPGRRARASSASVLLAIPTFELQSVGRPIDHDEMPRRIPARLAGLADPVSAWLQSVAALPTLPSTSDLTPVAMRTSLVQQPKDETGAIAGLEVVDMAKGTDDVQGMAEDAMVVVDVMPRARVGAESPFPLGRGSGFYAKVDATGHVFIPGVVEAGGNQTGTLINAFGFAQDGSINRFSMNVGSNSGGPRAALNHGTGGAFFTPFRPSDYATVPPGQILVARNNADPKRQFHALFSGLTVWYQDQAQPFKHIGGGLDLLGATAAEPEGMGIPTDARSTLAMDPVRVAAADLATLNLHRLRKLRERNLINKPLEKLQADAEDHLSRATAARERGEVRVAAAHDMVANVLGHRVHQPLRDSIQDLVNAVVILLLLCLPFAFALERLIFGFTSIYKQIAGFLGVFIATFLVLYATHPAFSLAQAPVIIFLAFVIILLSGFVIYVVMGKFKGELKAMQGLSSKVHGGQESRGTAFAAVAIGISGMRNRPLKTFLTATTVVLLTFTILVFASFSSSLGVVTTYLGASRGDQRIEFHTQSFLQMPERLLDGIEALKGDRYEVFVRGAAFKNPYSADASSANVVLAPKTLATQTLEGLIVIDPREAIDPSGAPRLGELFAPIAAEAPAGSAPPILLSELVANKLALAVGDELSLRGQRFRLAGTFPAKELKRLERIDGSLLVPPNFEATIAASAARSSSGSPDELFASLNINDFLYCSPDLVAIATFAGMERLGVIRNQVTLYPKEGADVAADAQELAEWLEGPVAATADGGSHRYFFTKAVEGSGFLEVLVPLLLGGLIIFSSLLGSIVDRQKEIFTFSALGLAPPHVAALFFAESAVFAVIGGMGGYLISQVVVKVLTLLSERGLADVPDVNFSSFSSIVTILIVMLTVILSTIYPAIMAGRSANPGIARKWRMPRPEGDTLRFTFPFTVSADSIAGILAFIREHFDNHGDASLGSFAARDVSLVVRDRQGGGRDMGLTAEIALAPFDLGVFQRFQMITRPSEIAGIDEVAVELTRLNGAPGTWVRGNRAFIDDLREQFLRWRSLPIDTVEHYHGLAERELGLTAAGATPAASDTMAGGPARG